MSSLEQEIGEILRLKGLTLGIVESATGGLISHRITNVAGCSDYYKGSITAYSNEAKINLAGVKPDTINQFGSVSPQTADELAHGGRKVLKSDICIADTGIAGPGGAGSGKPVGLFYIGLSYGETTYNRKHIFSGSREQNKQQAADTALRMLKDCLESLE